jgi:hypothetical protein
MALKIAAAVRPVYMCIEHFRWTLKVYNKYINEASARLNPTAINDKMLIDM